MISFILSITSIDLIDCRSHARIGDYSQQIPDNDKCGQSLSYLTTENHCFEYQGIPMAPIRNGRNAREGEVSWRVLIKIQILSYERGCTGTLISPQWVITAAHCFDLTRDEEISVYFGTKYLSGTPIICSKPIKYPTNEPLNNDIALLKLNTPAPIESNGQYFSINTICLPPNTTVLKEINPQWGSIGRRSGGSEFIFQSGWGIGQNGVLQIAERVIDYIEKPYKTAPNFHFIHYYFLGQQRSCQGDSGGPIWQYYMGRAVLIGVHNGSYNMTEGCGSSSFGAYVPDYIDWIIQTIKE